MSASLKHSEEAIRKTLACPAIVFLTIFSIIVMALPASSAQIRIGGAANYFMPSDSAYKDLYGRGGLTPAGSLSLELMRRLELRAEVGFFQDSGQMSLTREDIKLKLTTAVLGVRYRFIESRMLSPYAGVGVAVISYKEEVPPRLASVSKSTTGFEAEAGTYVNVTARFFLDLNFRYLSAEAKPLTESVKLGGIRFGIGVGYKF
jgi:opacity protein-like surface antigen